MDTLYKFLLCKKFDLPKKDILFFHKSYFYAFANALLWGMIYGFMSCMIIHNKVLLITGYPYLFPFIVFAVITYFSIISTVKIHHYRATKFSVESFLTPIIMSLFVLYIGINPQELIILKNGISVFFEKKLMAEMLLLFISFLYILVHFNSMWISANQCVIYQDRIFISEKFLFFKQIFINDIDAFCVKKDDDFNVIIKTKTNNYSIKNIEPKYLDQFKNYLGNMNKNIKFK